MCDSSHRARAHSQTKELQVSETRLIQDQQMEKETQNKHEKPCTGKAIPKNNQATWQENITTAKKPQASHPLFTDNVDDFHTEKEKSQIREFSTDV